MKSQLINFTIDSDLLKRVDDLAKKEAKSRSEVLREAARRLTKEGQERKRDFAAIRASGKMVNMPQNEAIALIDKVRATLPVNFTK